MQLEVQGHRGMRGLYPENTLAGFLAAIVAHVPVLECDILATSDGVLVVHHDFVINRKNCTYLGKSIETSPLLSSLTLEEIKRYDCGRTNAAFPGQIPIIDAKIPTLEELLTLVKKAPSVRLNLEIKRDASRPEMTFSPVWLANTILNEVDRSGLSRRTYFSSFDYGVLSEIRKLDPKAKLGLLFCEKGAAKRYKRAIPQSILDQAVELRVTTFSPEHTYLKTKDQVQALQKKGFRIISWTVNDPRRWKELIDMGVDGIITDYPSNLLKYLVIQPEPEM